jgi:hypothetical protein
MVQVMSLWIPILLSAVLVFLTSFLLHMVLRYHSSDYKKLPAEGDVLDALRKLNIPPGDYHFPRPDSMKAMKDPAFIEKHTKGPVGMMTIFKPGPPTMGAELFQWFLYSVLVGIFAAYVASRALEPGAPYLSVFRFAGTTAFLGYSVALMQNSIWYKRAWSATLKTMFDGLVYALLTAGVFGWLWPE